jgi:hypothetical protein
MNIEIPLFVLNLGGVFKPLLWGSGYTVPNALIVQSNCFIRPTSP